MARTQDRKQRVLITDPIDAEAEALLRRSGFIVHKKLRLQRKELLRLIPGYDALVCRTNTKLGTDFFDAATRLRCVGLASTGYDQIDLDAASKRQVAILGLPSHNTGINCMESGNFVSTAEHSVLLMLAALRDLYNASASMKDGRWEKHLFLGTEACGKTLGIVGFGRIGKLVSERARAFGMKVIAFDPHVSKIHMREASVTSVDFETLCKTADIISIHAPKTEETIGLFDAQAFRLMKKGVIIVNAARSEIISKKALIAALRTGKVRRIAMDVFTDEPLGVEWDLVSHPHVIPTPHIGGSTTEALRRISLEIVQNVTAYLKHGTQTHVINTLSEKTV